MGHLEDFGVIQTLITLKNYITILLVSKTIASNC